MVLTKRLVAVVLDTVDNMECNSDVSNASTLEAQPIETTCGERVSTATGTSFVMYKNRIPHLSSLSLILTVEQYG